MPMFDDLFNEDSKNLYFTTYLILASIEFIIGRIIYRTVPQLPVGYPSRTYDILIGIGELITYMLIVVQFIVLAAIVYVVLQLEEHINLRFVAGLLILLVGTGLLMYLSTIVHLNSSFLMTLIIDLSSVGIIAVVTLHIIIRELMKEQVNKQNKLFRIVMLFLILSIYLMMFYYRILQRIASKYIITNLFRTELYGIGQYLLIPAALLVFIFAINQYTLERVLNNKRELIRVIGVWIITAMLIGLVLSPFKVIGEEEILTFADIFVLLIAYVLGFSFPANSILLATYFFAFGLFLTGGILLRGLDKSNTDDFFSQQFMGLLLIFFGGVMFVQTFLIRYHIMAVVGVIFLTTRLKSNFQETKLENGSQSVPDIKSGM